MELCSLHPFDEAMASEFVRRAVRRAQAGAPARDPAFGAVDEVAGAAIASIRRGEEWGRFALTHALGRALAYYHPSFTHAGISLTSWEARVDRGVGMLMRPPARLLIDAGLDPILARTLPVRLDLSRGMMGGAYIPARLIPDFQRLLEARFERTVRRLVEAEWDGVAVFGMMLELAAYAHANGLAIFEAMDVVFDDRLAIVTADKNRLDKALRHRLEEAAKPPKKPGLLARLTGRARASSNGAGAPGMPT
jgi:hypothetical protein